MADTAVFCFGCNEAITDKIVRAMDHTWHPDHFCCSECKKPITESKFSEREGKPVCSKCYNEKFAEICYHCKEPITEKIIKAMDQTWHENHFVCGGACKKSLVGESFFEQSGKPYCKTDYGKLFAAKCFACKKPILDKSTIALDAKWHKECFKCKKCSTPILDGSFTVEAQKPICQKCKPSAEKPAA